MLDTPARDCVLAQLSFSWLPIARSGFREAAIRLGPEIIRKAAQRAPTCPPAVSDRYRIEKKRRKSLPAKTTLLSDRNECAVSTGRSSYGRNPRCTQDREQPRGAGWALLTWSAVRIGV
jgi:hypothetical protein